MGTGRLGHMPSISLLDHAGFRPPFALHKAMALQLLVLMRYAQYISTTHFLHSTGSTWSFLPSLIWNLSLFFLAYPGPPGFLGRTSLALRDYWRVKLGTSNRSGIAELELVQAIYGTMFHWMIGTWAHGYFPWVFWKSGIFAIGFRRDPWETLKLYYRYSTDFLTPKEQLDFAKHTKVMVYWYLGQAMCKLTLCCAWRSSKVFLQCPRTLGCW